VPGSPRRDTHRTGLAHVDWMEPSCPVVNRPLVSPTDAQCLVTGFLLFLPTNGHELASVSDGMAAVRTGRQK